MNWCDKHRPCKTLRGHAEQQQQPVVVAWRCVVIFVCSSHSKLCQSLHSICARPNTCTPSFGRTSRAQLARSTLYTSGTYVICKSTHIKPCLPHYVGVMAKCAPVGVMRRPVESGLREFELHFNQFASCLLGAVPDPSA